MLKIRQGRPSDAGPLSKLAYQTISDLDYNEYQLLDIEPYITFNSGQFPAYYFGVVEDPMIIGFYVLNFFSNNQTELKALYVQSSYQGKGYGRALLNHAKIQSRVLGSAELIFSGTEQSKEFFKVMGAQVKDNRALRLDDIFCTAMVLQL